MRALAQVVEEGRQRHAGHLAGGERHPHRHQGRLSRQLRRVSPHLAAAPLQLVHQHPQRLQVVGLAHRAAAADEPALPGGGPAASGPPASGPGCRPGAGAARAARPACCSRRLVGRGDAAQVGPVRPGARWCSEAKAVVSRVVVLLDAGAHHAPQGDVGVDLVHVGDRRDLAEQRPRSAARPRRWRGCAARRPPPAAGSGGPRPAAPAPDPAARWGSAPGPASPPRRSGSSAPRRGSAAASASPSRPISTSESPSRCPVSRCCSSACSTASRDDQAGRDEAISELRAHP